MRGRSRWCRSKRGKANDLIDRRTFSWTELLNQFEQTLPADVRITAVRPRVKDDRTVLVTVTAVGRTVDDVNQFMENLEETQAFAHLLVRDERMNEDGQVEVTLEANYEPKAGRRPAPAGAPPRHPDDAAARTASRGRSASCRHSAAVALVVNLGVYLFVVRPLGSRSAGAAESAAAAAAGGPGGRARQAAARSWSPARRAPTKS